MTDKIIITTALVEQAVKIAQVLGKGPATPDEARTIMGLKPGA